LRYDIGNLQEAAASKSNQDPRTVGETCSGSGAKPGTQPTVCTNCNGMGQVRFQQGFFSIARPCTSCRGTGKVIKDPCSECRGAGKVRATSTLTVKIPNGVDTGSRLRLTGEGEYGRGPPETSA
jgi:molecular chaperone DnaJ